MNCDPRTLAEAAKCFCFDKKTAERVTIYLLCQWANNTACQISWTPGTAIAQWTDGSGNHSGNLAVFLSTADIATVSLLNLDGTGITNIEGLNCLPSLQDAELGANSFTSLDITGCTSLVILECGNGLLETITGLGTATSLTLLGVSFCNMLGSLDLSVRPTLDTVQVSNNPNLTSVNLTGLINLLTFDCNTCPSLTALTLTGCTALTSVTCNDCAIDTLTDLDDCTSLLNLVASANQLTGLDVSSNTLIQNLYCDNNLIGSVNPLVITGCAALAQLNCSDNQIAGQIDVTLMPLLFIIACHNNSALTQVLLNNNHASLLGITFNNCNIPTAGLGGVDDIWSKVAASASISPTFTGNIDGDTVATNGPLTGGIANVDWITLNGLGWTQAFN